MLDFIAGKRRQGIIKVCVCLFVCSIFTIVGAFNWALVIFPLLVLILAAFEPDEDDPDE